MGLLNRQRAGELERELQRLAGAVAELKLLNELSLTASGALTLDEKLKIILEKSTGAVSAEQGSVLLTTGDVDFPFRTLIRQSDGSNLKQTYHISAHISGYVLYHKKPILIERLESDQRFEATSEERADIRSVLCVPIANQEDLIGVLMMINKKADPAFSEDDQRLLSIIATQAGQLIVNARLQEEKAAKDQQLALSRLEFDRLLELDRWRSRLFENVSHELRAPLTLILAPLEDLMAAARNDKIRNDYVLIRRNAQRLLRLINEMLDMCRIDAGNMKLEVAAGDLIPFVASIVDAFIPTAVQKGIALTLRTELDRCDAYFDDGKLETVLYNLLSNALKFTPPQGKVVVSLSQRERGADPTSPRAVILEVDDTGPGIPQESMGKVFDRYFQVHALATSETIGSGIGLCLAKELVQLHHGTITGENQPGGGSRFVVELPAGRGAYADAEVVCEAPAGRARGERHTTTAPLDERWMQDANRTTATTSSASKETLPLMLIVDDDAELRTFMHKFVGHMFRVLEAGNGEAGMMLAVETLPDVIVSDVVMPGMDGVELCRRLKTDERTSHIPVLLLTARSSQELKVASLETGADDYLIKPFDWPEFTARVHNLVDSREKVRRKTGGTALLNPSEMGIASMDEMFVKRAIAAVERSMGDENLTVEDLAASTGMSYGQMHRKLYALTNRTPAQFIRHMRLQRALEMIRNHTGTISEIAYTVGFGSPAYFTRCFHEHFGMAPGEVRAQSGNPPSRPTALRSPQ